MAVKFEFRTIKKEKVKDLIESQTFDLNSKKEFDQTLRELRKNNYVLEYQAVKGNDKPSLKPELGH